MWVLLLVAVMAGVAERSAAKAAMDIVVELVEPVMV